MKDRAPRIAVLDYGIGNLRSAEKALIRAGGDAVLTADPLTIGAADAVVLPGVGNFGRCMQALHETGLASEALGAVRSQRPFLGICVGMQLLFDSSEEAPEDAGLGVLSGPVRALPTTVKVPQMQWNQIAVERPIDLLRGLHQSWMYFVHSFAAEVTDDVVATCDYGGPVAAVVQRDNVMATQFHPEKSGQSGRRLLENFIEMAAGRNPEIILDPPD